MLNFRKLKQNFSSNILKEGREFYDKKKVLSAKIIELDSDSVRFTGKIVGNYENTYESDIEIDRFESECIHSNCDCTYRYDCQHIAGLVFYLEEHIDNLVIEFSKEKNLGKEVSFTDELMKTINEAKTKHEAKKDEKYQKEVLDEYIVASSILANAPFFMPKEDDIIKSCEIALIYNSESLLKKEVEFQLALRLPFRSKPLNIPNVKQFIEFLKFSEPIVISGKKYTFSKNSFDEMGRIIVKNIFENISYNDSQTNEKMRKFASMSFEAFGKMLISIYGKLMKSDACKNFSNEDQLTLPFIFSNSLENPLMCSFNSAEIKFEIEYMDIPAPKLLLNPSFFVDQNDVAISDVALFECSKPSIIYQDTFFIFKENILRKHIKALEKIREMTIPEPLFGTFVENSIPEMKRYSEVTNLEEIEKFVTLPFAGELLGKCKLTYLDGELEATITFLYDGIEIPSINTLSYDTISSFVTSDGIIARNLVEEKKIIDDLFIDFVYLDKQGMYVTKSEKKIVEFMTEIIPRNKGIVDFDCPQNLLEQFIYDDTEFVLDLDYKDKVGTYSIDLKVKGELKGVSLDLLWECTALRRSYVEFTKAKKKDDQKFSKILVIDLEKISKLVQIFDEIGIRKLDSQKDERPIWSLVNISEKSFENLPVKFSMSKKIKEIQNQMLGQKNFVPSKIPDSIKADLRPYQTEGIHWLEKLRKMYLNGILADDMGLGKTLQAIVSVSQESKNATSLVVCPTSLLYNWKEEILKFSKDLKVLVVDGNPQQRKKTIEKIKNYNIIITSYTLLQKDIETYQNTTFLYSILDEAQHIKNRGTRNAKSVKMIKASHKMILTGTPIENSLEELWSLFDYLMPGLLSSFDRFSEKYLKATGQQHVENMQYLKKKVFPFILRRMKTDVLKDLPAVSELTYHCKLSPVQMELYRSYAKSAKDELTKLVKKQGFEKVQIHVLATLTRLKQICCHPAIFAKEKVEVGDSAKYEMLLELLKTLVEGSHKTVIFSQYTKMLHIMRKDFESRNIKFSYLDGTTKNRLEIVKEFNENKKINVFLVSLKAGGTGLNITGADTVIHYDMWWNPAVENQATDRVHRIGQTKMVSAYKLVTKDTIEEKIVEMQKRKKGLVKKVVSCDDEVISRLTWDDVLELLKT